MPKSQDDAERSLMGTGGSCRPWSLGPSVFPAHYETPTGGPLFPTGAQLGLPDGRPDFHTGFFWSQRIWKVLIWFGGSSGLFIKEGRRAFPLWASPLLTCPGPPALIPPPPSLEYDPVKELRGGQWAGIGAEGHGGQGLCLQYLEGRRKPADTPSCM